MTYTGVGFVSMVLSHLSIEFPAALAEMPWAEIRAAINDKNEFTAPLDGLTFAEVSHLFGSSPLLVLVWCCSAGQLAAHELRNAVGMDIGTVWRALDEWRLEAAEGGGKAAAGPDSWPFPPPPPLLYHRASSLEGAAAD